MPRDGLNTDPGLDREALLADYYKAFRTRTGVAGDTLASPHRRTLESLIPHTQLRLTLLADPAMAALLPGSPCFIALGQQEDFPFLLQSPDLLLLAPTMLSRPAAMTAAARWGMEAAWWLFLDQPVQRSLIALARHGGALIAGLPCADRSLLIDSLPRGVASELVGSDLEHPSKALLRWLAERLQTDFPPEELDGDAGCLGLEAPVEHILVANSDSRLVVDKHTGKNRYGATVRPRPEAVHFSSSTASSISDYGFLYCDILRRDLLRHQLLNGRDAHAAQQALSDAVVGALRDICAVGENEVDGVVAPSGTDTEVLALLLARAAAPDEPLVNLLISPEETGRGVKLAGQGCYFDQMSATGAVVAKEAPIWPDADIQRIDIGIRNARGEQLPPGAIDDAFLREGAMALDGGNRVLAHVLVGSKTGLSGPSPDAVEALVARAPERVDVVVDACQMRIAWHELGAILKRGWMVQVSGSKSLTGPPFSGALLFPTTLRSRLANCQALMRSGIGFTEDWSIWWSGRMARSELRPGFGPAFRWLPALLEMALLQHVPEELRLDALQRFHCAVSDRVYRSAYLRPLDLGPGGGGDSRGQSFLDQSIVSFEVLARAWNGTLQPLDEQNCRRLFELLNRDARPLLPDLPPAVLTTLGQEFHIGQPVGLGEGDARRAVLRLVIGIRFFNIVGHAGAGASEAALESEIADLARAIDKLEVLAEHWWRFNRDIP
jgi:hypothetical protein